MKMVDIGQALNTLANVGVILGIVFLAYELRQNTSVARQDAYNSFAQTINELNVTISTDVGLSELLSQVNHGASRNDFSPAERLRVDMFHLANLRAFESLYQSVNSGIVDNRYFESLSVVGAFQSPYFLDYWPQARQALSPEFVEYLESNIPALN